MAPGQKLIRAVKAKESPAHAYLWLSLAASVDHPAAQDRLARIKQKITDNDDVLANQLRNDWQNAPCEYNEVFATE